MRHKVTNAQVLMLNHSIGKLMMDRGYIKVLRDIKYETKNENTYVIEMVLVSYHSEGHFLGTHNEESCIEHLNSFNFYQARNSWLNLKEQLKALGFRIIPIIDPLNKMKDG